MIKKSHFYVLIIACLSLILLFGCVELPKQPIWPSSPTSEKISTGLPKFSSCTDIVSAFKNAKSISYYGIEKSITTMPTVTTGAIEYTAAQEHSPTNVQVAGVDEADIVKTDGKNIYTVSNGKLYIVEAYPAESAKELSSTTLVNITPYEIFINGNTVLIFGGKHNYWYDEEYNALYKYYYADLTVLQLWDISNKEKPKLLRTLEFEGAYISSRKIESTAYFILRKYQYSIPEDPGKIVPLYRDQKTGQVEKQPTEITKCGDIGYLPPVNAKSFVIVGAISMSNPDAEIKKEVVVASGENIYASFENLYVAEVDYSEGWYPYSGIPYYFYQSSEKTIVHKFAIDTMNISYLGSMNAAGYILNQFSMDEYNGYFRIATTKSEILPYGKSTTSNNIYTFDSELKQKGKLEDLAPGEKIYSARFIGDRAYLVTFKKVDPLFVINLSNQEKPEVLGELKIPGYSDYLHPIDKDHIIGVGKETVEAEEGDFAWDQGLKMAVFDVSDVSKPKEMHKIVIGDRGTNSYALNDHKAFLYDKKKELLVLPIKLAVIDREKYGEDIPANTYGDFVFDGAYVYKLTLNDGFQLKGEITHIEDNKTFEKYVYYYYVHGDSVKRSLYIEDVLYTVSDNKIIGNALSDLTELTRVKLN